MKSPISYCLFCAAPRVDFMFDTLTERIKRDAGDAHHRVNLSLRVAGLLAMATLVFAALYFFVRSLQKPHR